MGCTSVHQYRSQRRTRQTYVEFSGSNTKHRLIKKTHKIKIGKHEIPIINNKPNPNFKSFYFLLDWIRKSAWRGSFPVSYHVSCDVLLYVNACKRPQIEEEETSSLHHIKLTFFQAITIRHEESRGRDGRHEQRMRVGRCNLRTGRRFLP